LNGIERISAEPLAQTVSVGDRVAVKVPIGEYGNLNYLRPLLVRKVVDIVKEMGGKPFVTDTTTLYPNRRFTASEYLKTAALHGYTEKTIGAPIRIADGEKGYDGAIIPLTKIVDGCSIKEVEVARAFFEVDKLVVLSHVKGHEFAGFGGAIKNLAMGCVTKIGKAAQHAANRPIFNDEKCNSCNQCVEGCRFGAMTMLGDKPAIDQDECKSCLNCFFNCPQKAYSLPKNAKEVLQINLAHAASAVISRFNGKVVYLNFLQDVVDYCDCVERGGDRLVNDVGILSSIDPVAIDKASLDLIDKAPSFKKLEGPDRFGHIHGTSSYIQLNTAEKLGIGKLGYELVTI
jgi:uncharacterized protein